MNGTAAVSLEDVGWKFFFQQQLADFPPHLVPARVVAVQRTGLSIAPPVNGHEEVAVAGRFFVQHVEARPTVGDWVLIDPETGALEAVLQRTSLIKRLNPVGEVQLLAANIDTAFIVSSCNADFNAARLERYLSVVLDAQIQPVLVLTKMDLAQDPAAYRDKARKLGSNLPIEVVNTLDETTLQGLTGWCGPGQSIALLGSSGVGKSTLVNTLCKASVQTTRAIREDDAKGRHTTTHRSMHVLPQGGVILDSPGMRELQLAEAEQGLEVLFADIEELAMRCRFNDCGHDTEPGCAVRAAIEKGDLDEQRLTRYYKLQREEQINRETVAQRHARGRQFARQVKIAQENSHKKKE